MGRAKNQIYVSIYIWDICMHMYYVWYYFRVKWYIKNCFRLIGQLSLVGQMSHLKFLISPIFYQKFHIHVLIAYDLWWHTMSELGLTLHKSTKESNHWELLFKHWTKLFPYNWNFLLSPFWGPVVHRQKTPPKLGRMSCAC